MTVSRQLSAIMFTDIVGYTAMMGNNEEKAFSLIKMNRDIHLNAIEPHNGRLIKELGDGMLLSFPSVSEAMLAAMNIQQACEKISEINLRIGIHYGEIIFENNDVFGDAVNIASRIQTLGVPGSILFSKSIANEIKNKSGFELTSLGSFDFKHVDEPMEIFALSNPGFAVPKKTEMDGKLKSASGKSTWKKNVWIPIGLLLFLVAAFILFKDQLFGTKGVTLEMRSMAILPFENLQRDSTLYFLTDGIPENLINSLSALETHLKVFSRSATFGLPDSAKTNEHLHKLLNTDLVMRGSLQKSANESFLRCELVDAVSQNQLWGNKYLLDMNDISGLENSILADLMRALKIQSKNEVNENRGVDPAAYAEYLMGRHLSYGSTPQESEKALEHFREAIRIDPKYALAYAALANEKVVQGQFGTASTKEIIYEARTALEAAKALDPSIPMIYTVTGALNFYYEWEWQDALEAYRKALDLSPADVQVYIRYSTTLAILGRHTESIPLANKAIELDPVSISSLHNLGWCNLLASNFKESHEAFGKALELHPNWIWGYIKKAYGHALLGEYDEAIMLADKAQTLLADGWGSELIQDALAFIYTKCNEKEKADAVIERFLTYASQNTVKDPSTLSSIYYLNGNYEKAIEWEWKAVEQNSSNAYTFYIPLKYDKIFFNSAEHQQIIKAMGFKK
ncbi:adenylate/guanylate cyclase domain-containing protein [Aquiflexum sp.]|uniref:adenylate/guanylate cyclase domain-containing protein n=1 Tax=Aquiflexum sp. TaxID=1872584 RepID=UPI0035931CA6